MRINATIPFSLVFVFYALLFLAAIFTCPFQLIQFARPTYRFCDIKIDMVT